MRSTANLIGKRLSAALLRTFVYYRSRIPHPSIACNLRRRGTPDEQHCNKGFRAASRQYISKRCIMGALLRRSAAMPRSAELNLHIEQNLSRASHVRRCLVRGHAARAAVHGACYICNASQILSVRAVVFMCHDVTARAASYHTRRTVPVALVLCAAGRVCCTPRTPCRMHAVRHGALHVASIYDARRIPEAHSTARFQRKTRTADITLPEIFNCARRFPEAFNFDPRVKSQSKLSNRARAIYYLAVQLISLL
eukprot:IDg959t1